MRIAVVGAGIFGITTTVRLASQGISVDLFEEKEDILSAASGINQFRLHRGYHYPRSPRTVQECIESEAEFRQEFAESIVNSSNEAHFYCISTDKSLVTADEYLRFCRSFNLEVQEAHCPFIDPGHISLCVKVPEKRIDISLLRKSAVKKLAHKKIRIILGTKATPSILQNYDFVVLATYAQYNELAWQLTGKKKKLQFELCEKPVVTMPTGFQKVSIVVMDGPFMCIDPFISGSTHVLGNVVWAIHQEKVGYRLNPKKNLAPLLNLGIVRRPSVSHYDKFIESGSRFIPQLRQAQYQGSMFTIRTVLPHIHSTDARPTMVERLDERTISIFSGKLGTCVSAANQVLDMILNPHRKHLIA